MADLKDIAFPGSYLDFGQPLLDKIGVQEATEAVQQLAHHVEAEIYVCDDTFVDRPPVKWYTKLRWRWWAFRERLGEIVAGRRFSDDY